MIPINDVQMCTYGVGRGHWQRNLDSTRYIKTHVERTNNPTLRADANLAGDTERRREKDKAEDKASMKRIHHCRKLTMSLFDYTNRKTRRLYLLDVICGDALRDTTALNIRPPVTAIAVDQHEAITLCHRPLHIASSLVVVHRFDVLQLLGTAARRHSRPDPLGGCAASCERG